MRKLVVKSNEEGQRIDKYIRKYLNNAPLSFIYKLFFCQKIIKYFLIVFSIEIFRVRVVWFKKHLQQYFYH